MIRKLILIYGILTTTLIGYGQVNIPTFESPKPATFTDYTKTVTTPTGNPTFVPNYNQSNGLTRTQQNNQMIMQEVEYHQKQMRNQQMMNNNPNNGVSTINYELPSYDRFAGTEHYKNAFSEIEKMLSGEKPLDLKRAVFLTENAYCENQLEYEKFENAINQISDLCKIKIQQEKGNVNDDLTKRIMIYRFMSDTLEFYDYQKEQPVYSYPMKYDFEDYEGKKDWSKMFVTKLLMTNKGQCHSMPLLYMILAQELETDAYLSFSPSHSFVKMQDNDKQWYNLELTNGIILSDAAMIESGYVKAQALRNKIYMDTIGTKKVVAQCLVDLAQGYKNKYGYDNFVIQCSDKALEYFPNNVFAMQLKSDCLTINFDYVAYQYGKPPLSVLQKDEKAMQIFNKRNEMYLAVDETGYEPMPSEKYEAWLKSLNTEKNKAEHKQQIIHLNSVIKH